MNKKGFTLVELLAVIAILAILVIIALPNIMSMFNQARMNSFSTEVKEIYKMAQQQWISDSLFTTSDRTYARCSSGCTNSLSMSGRTQLDYYIKIDKAGKVVKYFATDGTYQYRFSNSNGLNIEDIKDVEQVTELEEGYVISIANNRVINENGPVTLGTFTIWGVTYTFEVGMTWEDFLNSEYNTAGFEFIDGEGISMESSQMSCGPSTIIDIHMIVADQEWSIIELEDEIINNYTYRNTPSASC